MNGSDGIAGGGVRTPPVPLREILHRFWPYTKPYRRWIPLILVLLVLAPALDTVGIWMFKLLVDNVFVPHDFRPFVWLAAAYIAITLANRLVSFGDSYLSAWIGERFLVDLRTSFFRHLHSLSLDFFAERQLGDTLSRLSDDIGAIENLILSDLASAISYLLTIVFYAGVLFLLRWDLALVSLVVGPLFLIVSSRFSRLIKMVSREKRRLSGSITAVAQESLGNAALVHAYNRQDSEVARFHRTTFARYQTQMASIRVKALYGALIDLIEILAILVVIGLGTWDLARGLLSLGGVLVFLALLSQLYSPIRGISSLLNSAYSASASAERVIEYLEQPAAVQEHPNARLLKGSCGRLSFENVSFAYAGGKDHPALDCVSFHLEPGETVALVGPSGAGKSTIAKLLLRFYDPTAGRILLDGQDLRDIELHSLRDHIAVVLQETLIFDGTIRDNIAFGRPGATDDDIIRAAIAADAHSFISALAAGYQTIVGQKGLRVSGGQRQRIAIARALIRDAPILILDEPMTGLDNETAERILAPLQRLMHGRTTIIITHNLAAARVATTILVIEDGRVIERGNHAKLADREEPYASVARPQEVRHEFRPQETRAPIRSGFDRRELRWPKSLSTRFG